MAFQEHLLIYLLLLPFIGAAVGAFLPSGKAARYWALLISLGTAALVVVLACHFFNAFDAAPTRGNPISRFFRITFSDQTVRNLTVTTIGFSVNLGVDAISMWLVMLTVFLMPLAVGASFGSIRDREKEYYAWMTLLLGAMVGVFLARDGLLFYVFFELTLIPMFFIIGIWGGLERRAAAGKFFLFTFTGSVFTLAAIVYLAMNAGGPGQISFSISKLIAHAQDDLSSTERFWVVLGIIAGLAVKVPLFPVHTWLPLAHTEAPTAGSVILAGVLLKLGTYGMLRLAVPIGLVANGKVVSPGLIQVIGVLCLIGILYGALVAWVQQDIKKLVAYSSVSHLGFCILGLVALNEYGMQGSVLYMVNHGLSTGAMFLVIGMIYDRYHTRDINALSGLARIMPKMAFFFVLFVMASIGLPGLNGFVSEFLTILGAFTSDHLGVGYGVIAALGIILGAVYMLHMTAKVIFGPLRVPEVEHGHGGQADHGQAASPDHAHAHGGGHGGAHGHKPKMNDLTGREMAILAPIALACVLLGFMPNSVLSPILGPIKAIAPVDPRDKSSAVLPPPAPPARESAGIVPAVDHQAVAELKSNDR